MICASCRDRLCRECLSVSCSCGHENAGLRPLTHQERHEYAMGLRTTYLLPRDQPPAPEPLTTVHVNGKADL